jgi:hypothetical protein
LAIILTLDGFFGAKFDIRKPRWLVTQAAPPIVGRAIDENLDFINGA